MLAAINTNSLKYYTIDDWLNSNAYYPDKPCYFDIENEEE